MKYSYLKHTGPILVTIAAACAAFGLTCSRAHAASADADNAAPLLINRVGTQPSTPGPSQFFTGAVRVDPLNAAKEPSRVSTGYVNFEPGARSAWHTHPLGQTLIVTAGSGRVQRWGSPIEVIRAGDTVWIPPGVKHWHGASATTGLTHIAVTEALDGRNVDWLEQVTEDQYRR